MTTLHEVARQALEALEDVRDMKWSADSANGRRLLADLRRALEAEQQDDIEWRNAMDEWRAAMDEWYRMMPGGISSKPMHKQQFLTDEQIIAWVESGEHNVTTNDWASHIEFARAVEAEVLKKNVNSDLNLNCKSVQRRLATQWGFVPKQTVTYNPNRNVQPPQYQIVSER